MDKKIGQIKAKRVPILKEHGAVRAGIFGSFARGEAKKSSDIGILVELVKGKALLDLVRLERGLKIALGNEVDLLAYKPVNPLIKEKVLAEGVRVM